MEDGVNNYVKECGKGFNLVGWYCKPMGFLMNGIVRRVQMSYKILSMEVKMVDENNRWKEDEVMKLKVCKKGWLDDSFMGNLELEFT